MQDTQFKLEHFKDGASAAALVHADLWEDAIDSGEQVLAYMQSDREAQETCTRADREAEEDAAIEAAWPQELINELAGAMGERRRLNAQRGVVSGGSFVLDQPEQLPTIWGRDEAPLWVDGEGLLIVGPQGVGKTTLAQQLVLARAGILVGLLDMPVATTNGKILYLAMDRPSQIARAWRRMVSEHDRVLLDERVAVWRGPLPFSLTKSPRVLATWARDEHGAADIFVDSYKDLAPDLSSEMTGAQINEAVQECLAEGIGWVGLHHHRKGNADNPTPKNLEDVYGSNWLTAGLGSVLGLGGKPGADVLEAKHLKQPAESLGTFGIRHDHARGTSELTEPPEMPANRRTMKAKRQAQIEELLDAQPAREFTLKEVAAKAGSTEQTLREDMRDLEAAGTAERTTPAGTAPHRWRAKPQL